MRLHLSVFLSAWAIIVPLSLAFTPVLEPLDSKAVATTSYFSCISGIYNRCSMVAQMVPVAYSHCLITFPLVTESITAGAMAGLGDYLAQTRQHTITKYDKGRTDKRRTSRFILKGFGEGILWSFWYRFAEHWSHIITLGVLHWMGLGQTTSPHFAKILRTVISVGLDLLLACPLIYGAWDIPFLTLMSGKSVKKIPMEIRQKMGPMLRASFLLWTPVNVVIYNAPLRYRVILSSAADVLWQSMVSTILSPKRVDDHSSSSPDADEGFCTAEVSPSRA